MDKHPPRLRIPWKKRKPIPPERLQATVLIHIGLAWRAHLDGDAVLAIRRLSMAVEAIMQLIDEWTTGAAPAPPVAPVDPDQQ